MNNYADLNEQQKINLIKKLYEEEKKSFIEIAKQLNTYSNKVRRDAIKYNIKIRDKSEAQKNALKNGKHCHPTKGKTRTETEKMKIGNGVMKSWEKLTPEQLQNRKITAKNNWDNLTEEERQHIQKKANEAVRKTSKVGSKLEKFIANELIKNGHKIQFHQEQFLSNTKLQIDIMIPSMNVAIEIDGPSHFAPVWGSDSLKRNVKYDQKKTGLILGKGLVLIRIKQNMDYSTSRARLVYNKLQELLKSINNRFPSIDNRNFQIEDNE